MPDGTPLRLAVLGFGEAGALFARDLRSNGADVSVYDPRFQGPEAEELRGRAEAMDVRACSTGRAAADGADLAVSAVTASSALDVARQAAGFISAGQYFLDVNSVAAETRTASALAIEQAGGRYVEAAVMAPVRSQGIAVPMLLGGPWAREAKALLEPYGAKMEVVAEDVGVASAVKLSRSLMTKGMEALAVECMVTARHYGTEAQVIASLSETYPGIDWETRMAYLLTRSMLHGRRRAEEMREAAKMVRAAGLDPTMATATAERHEWVSGLGVGSAVEPGETPALAPLVDALRNRTEPRE